MSDKKPLYLLAGGRRGGDKSITLALREIAGLTGTVSPNIAYVGAASGDNRAFYLFISAALKSAGAGKIDLAAISPRKASLDKVKKIIEDSDAVFISGGDVEAGMGVLQKKNMVGYFQDVYARGKVFFGASAGSIMLAREWVRWKDPDDDSSAEIFPCLGLAPVICDTHA
jgi:peptidase E